MAGPEERTPEPEGQSPFKGVTMDVIERAGLDDKEAQVALLRGGIVAGPDTPLRPKQGIDEQHPGTVDAVQAIEEGCAQALQKAGEVIVEDGEIRQPN